MSKLDPRKLSESNHPLLIADKQAHKRRILLERTPSSEQARSTSVRKFFRITFKAASRVTVLHS